MQIRLNGTVSSQYLTSLLMAAPLAEGEGATEIICEELISQPYVEMTVKLMERFNVKVDSFAIYAVQATYGFATTVKLVLARIAAKLLAASSKISKQLFPERRNERRSSRSACKVERHSKSDSFQFLFSFPSQSCAMISTL